MTPSISVRAATADDYPAAAVLRAGAARDRIITPEGMQAGMATVPAENIVTMLAAEAAGELVGWCLAMRKKADGQPDAGLLDVSVAPDVQRRGLGTQLAATALDQLEAGGITVVRALSSDGPAQLAFAARLGFVEAESNSMSAVDPRTVALRPVPDGVVLKPFGEITDPEPLWRLSHAAERDIPGDNAYRSSTFDEWKADFWHTIFADDEASLAAYVGDEVVALTMLRVDRPSRRAQNDLTATRPDFRGQGLAEMIKSHSLHRAAAAGVTTAITENHEKNAGMLAVNRKLGYRPSSRRIEWERRS